MKKKSARINTILREIDLYRQVQLVIYGLKTRRTL